MVNTIPMAEPSIRHVARVILLDRVKNILLVKYEDSVPMDPKREGRIIYWVPPGGKLEGDEGHRAAAKRELIEESGLSAEIGPWIWKSKHLLRLNKVLVTQEERYFLAEIDIEKPPVANQSSEDISEVRWWSITDLKNSSAVFFPDSFLDLILPILDGEIPSYPIQV
jgi:8-oxo-dGTP diphosphatase